MESNNENKEQEQSSNDVRKSFAVTHLYNDKEYYIKYSVLWYKDSDLSHLVATVYDDDTDLDGGSDVIPIMVFEIDNNDQVNINTYVTLDIDLFKKLLLRFEKQSDLLIKYL
jgi:hypothetical protein